MSEPTTVHIVVRDGDPSGIMAVHSTEAEARADVDLRMSGGSRGRYRYESWIVQSAQPSLVDLLRRSRDERAKGPIPAAAHDPEPGPRERRLTPTDQYAERILAERPAVREMARRFVAADALARAAEASVALDHDPTAATHFEGDDCPGGHR